MKSHYLLISVFAIISICIESCQEVDNHPDPILVELGTSFDIRYEETVQIKDEGIQLTFMAISDDSRCPENVVCVWQGRVAIVLNAGTIDIPLSVGAVSEPTKSFKNYSVTFQEVIAPMLNTEKTIKKSDYIVQLLVEKQ